MKIFDDFSRPIIEAIEELGLADGEVEAFVDMIVRDGSAALLDELRRTAPKMLRERRKLRKGFEDRNYDRWREPLDELKRLWVICQELSEAQTQEKLKFEGCLVFDTLASLQPRALLVASEILKLLEAGFPDGALARWRSLHEFAVTSMFIRKHGFEAARRYQYSIWFSKLKRANKLNRYASRLKVAQFSDEDLSEIRQKCSYAEAELGRVLKRIGIGLLNRSEDQLRLHHFSILSTMSVWTIGAHILNGHVSTTTLATSNHPAY